MHLNQLYAYFGRKLETLETVNRDPNDLDFNITTRIVKSRIDIDKDNITLLLQNNLNYDIIKELKGRFDLDIKKNYTKVKSNVGIASAVTAYARIHMLKFK